MINGACLTLATILNTFIVILMYKKVEKVLDNKNE